jgi:hypothetical protein
MTKAEIDLIVGWLTEPESFDFMIDENRALLTKARQALKTIITGSPKRLFWAVRADNPKARPEIVEINLCLDTGDISLQVMRIGDDSGYDYDDFRDYTPIAPPVNSPT